MPSACNFSSIKQALDKKLTTDCNAELSGRRSDIERNFLFVSTGDTNARFSTRDAMIGKHRFSVMNEYSASGPYHLIMFSSFMDDARLPMAVVNDPDKAEWPVAYSMRLFRRWRTRASSILRFL